MKLEPFAATRQQILNGHGCEKTGGAFDSEPRDETQSMEIIAKGRGDWIGWVELAKEAVDETATRMTARVIQEVDADILGLVEAKTGLR